MTLDRTTQSPETPGVVVPYDQNQTDLEYTQAIKQAIRDAVGEQVSPEATSRERILAIIAMTQVLLDASQSAPERDAVVTTVLETDPSLFTPGTISMHGNRRAVRQDGGPGSNNIPIPKPYTPPKAIEPSDQSQ